MVTYQIYIYEHLLKMLFLGLVIFYLWLVIFIKTSEITHVYLFTYLMIIKNKNYYYYFSYKIYIILS